MKQYISYLYAVSALILCSNFGSNTSESGPKKPSLCFYGTVTFENNEKIPVKNILFGGIFERIPFFGVPSVDTIEPTVNTTFLALDNILSIKPSFEKASDGVKRYKNREYITVTVTLKGSEKGLSTLAHEPQEKQFLVEKNRKISCDQTITGGDIEKEFTIEAIKEISILGLRQGERKSTPQDSPKEPSAAKEALCAQTKKDLQQLDSDSKGIFATMIQKIRNSVNYICG